METLHETADPWPALVCAAIAALVWAGFRLRMRATRNRLFAQGEHDRMTGWLPELRDPEASGPVILRDESTNRIILPSHLIKGRERQPGRHRADRLTSR